MRNRRLLPRPSGAFSPLQAAIRRATELIVAIRREFGEEGEELRADVLGGIKEALTGAERWLETITVEGEPQFCATTEGVFRMVFDQFGVDRSDLRLQEVLFEWVRQSLDELLDEDRG